LSCVATVSKSMSHMKWLYVPFVTVDIEDPNHDLIFRENTIMG